MYCRVLRFNCIVHRKALARNPQTKRLLSSPLPSSPAPPNEEGAEKVRFKIELYHTIVIVWVYYTTQVDDTRPEAGFFFCNGLQYNIIFGGVAIRMVVVRNVTFVQACTKPRVSNSIVRQNEKGKKWRSRVRQTLRQATFRISVGRVARVCKPHLSLTAALLGFNGLQLS